MGRTIMIRKTLTPLVATLFASTLLSACAVADYSTSPGYNSPQRSGYDAPRRPAFNNAYYTIDQADGFASAIGSSPPDYSFRFGRVDAWAWVGVSGETLLMESGQAGDIQYYFQRNGSLPYLIRDEDDVSYGFDRGNLIAIFGPDGSIVDDGNKAADHMYADRLLERARELLFASTRRGWDNRSARSWTSSFGINFILNSGWGGGWRNQYGWDPRSRYDDDYYYWRQEEWRRRHDHGNRYRDWHRRGGRNAPPAYSPPAYTETPHTRPVLGDRAGPIMDAGGRGGPREGYGSGGGENPAIAMPPAIVPPSGDAPPLIGRGGGDPPPIIVDPRVDDDMPRRRPRPMPSVGGGDVAGAERPRPQNGVIATDRQPDAMPTDAGQQMELGRLREMERQRQAREEQQLRNAIAAEQAQLRAEEGRVQAEIAQSRAHALEQAGQRDRGRDGDGYAPQRERGRDVMEQREEPRYEAPRYEAPRYEAPPPPPPQPQAAPPPPASAPAPPQVESPPPPPQQESPQRVYGENERPD